MDAAISSSSRIDQNAPRMLDAQYDRPQEDVRMPKPHKSHQHHASHRGTTTRYKEKFQAMREKYEHVNARREAFNRELEISSEKERQLQAENDLLLDTLAIVMAPPQMDYRMGHSSAHADIPLPPRDVHSPAPEGLALPTNGLRDSHHAPRLNGAMNGSAPNGSSAGLHEVREPAEHNSHEENQERH